MIFQSCSYCNHFDLDELYAHCLNKNIGRSERLWKSLTFKDNSFDQFMTI